MNDVERRRELGQQLRVDSIRPSAVAKSGHPSSGLSAADLMAVLLDGYLRYDFDEPRNPANDRLVFSKGHASTLMYAMFRAAGAIGDEELESYRQFDSIFEGHPTPRIPWVDVATGSLGQGLPLGVGMAIAGKYLDRLPYRVWVLCGDSEMAEGSMWEAFEHATHYELDNLTAIIDVNRLGQRGETMVGWDLDMYRDRAHAFGWETIEIDGHDVEAIDRAYTEAASATGKPAVVIARTIKGTGVKAVENQLGWHGKALDNPDEAIEELGGMRNIHVDVAKPDAGERHTFPSGDLELPRYDVGDEVATRKAYGEALAALGAARGDVVALDGEVSNSTFAEFFAKAHPERYFEMYISEQQMLAAAVGLQARGWNAFASTFAAFLSRAYDFIRMAAISRVNLRLAGSHAGVSIIGAGVTLHEALKAADSLADDGITARVIDLYSIKPIDVETLQAAAEATGRIVTVEDHFPEGGLGDAVLAAPAENGERARVAKLAVSDMPRSGKPAELLNAYGIDAEHISAAAR